MELFTNGAAAFSDILHCIEQATTSIHIHMFIWRDDAIGCRIAKAVLAAAERGVQCEICVDRIGALFEYSEESQKSLFHPRLSAWEKLEVKLLTWGGVKQHTTGTAHSDIAARLFAHPNIRIQNDVKTNDHSKFYVFDDEILIFGGINIEDKENGADARGVEYRDYMVKIEGKDYVSAFRQKRKEKINALADPVFLVNMKKPHRYFEIERNYVQLIKESKRELTIVMAYFSYIKSIQKPLLQAVNRGVQVTILISGSANFQDASNKRSVRKLLKLSKNRIRLYFSPRMLHTKLLLADDAVCFGSCNMAKQSFFHLDELNVLTGDPSLVRSVQADVAENLSCSTYIGDYRQIRYPRIKAFLESLVS